MTAGVDWGVRFDNKFTKEDGSYWKGGRIDGKKVHVEFRGDSVSAVYLHTIRTNVWTLCRDAEGPHLVEREGSRENRRIKRDSTKNMTPDDKTRLRDSDVGSQRRRRELILEDRRSGTESVDED